MCDLAYSLKILKTVSSTDLPAQSDCDEITNLVRLLRMISFAIHVGFVPHVYDIKSWSRLVEYEDMLTQKDFLLACMVTTDRT